MVEDIFLNITLLLYPEHVRMDKNSGRPLQGHTYCIEVQVIIYKYFSSEATYKSKLPV